MLRLPLPFRPPNKVPAIPNIHSSFGQRPQSPNLLPRPNILNQPNMNGQRPPMMMISRRWHVVGFTNCSRICGGGINSVSLSFFIKPFNALTFMASFRAVLNWLKDVAVFQKLVFSNHLAVNTRRLFYVIKLDYC